MTDKIVLKAKRDYSVVHRHPWIFSGAVASVVGRPPKGGTLAVTRTDGALLGWGSYSPESMIRVRMLAFGDVPPPDAAYVDGLVRAAVARRAAFLASGVTNACRLIHGESDGLPGVVADCYDGYAVVQLSTAGAEFWKDALVAALMAHVPNCRGVYNRSDVDGRLREGLPAEGDAVTGVLAGAEVPERIEIFEGRIRYFVDVRRGHKTGFYLDQREARGLVGSFASGADVLNCFSYTGGFGLAAGAGGARSVTHLDLSEGALALARENTALSGLDAAKSEFVAADVFQQLRRYRDQGRSFDLIVLDPPKFADTKGQLMRALRGYKDINLLAMKLLRPQGLLATFSCSGAMQTDMFDTVCREAAFDARRDFQVIARTRQAADHPVALTFPEGFYLKGLLLRALN